mmetsp:Transcript_10086/g.28721  ORF Transcript_10086/g.28721 Transcript_10086/m.28721 type:complete len:451 (-) Transcript_10086:225-1577(-)
MKSRRWMDVLVFVRRTAVDDLQLLAVDQDASGQGLRALIVILGRRKDREDAGALADGNTLRMGLVGAHDVREALLLQEVRDCLAAEADGAASAQRFSEPGFRIDGMPFLVFGGRIAPDAVGCDLLAGVVLMLVGWVDSGDLRHVEDVLDARGIHRHGTGDPTVHAKDVLIHDAGQRESIEDLVARLPNSISDVIAKPIAALVDEGAFGVVLLPAVDISRFVISAQQKDLIGELQLHRQKVRGDLQTGHSAIDVISQEQKVAGGEGHPQPPDVVGKEVQILKISMDIAEDVGRALQEDDARLPLQYVAHLLAELEEVLGELVAVQVVDVRGRALEHVEDADGQRVRGVLALHRRQRRHDLLRADAGVAAHALSLGPQHRALATPASDLLDVHGMGRHLPALALGTAAGMLRSFQLVCQRAYLGLQGCDFGIPLVGCREVRCFTRHEGGTSE